MIGLGLCLMGFGTSAFTRVCNARAGTTHPTILILARMSFTPMYKAKFQSFEDLAERAASLPRVGALRTELARRGLTGWVVPRADRHQNEYVPDSDEPARLADGIYRLGGRGRGSDGARSFVCRWRYTLQVRDQVDTSIFEIVHLSKSPPDQWIERNLTSSDRLGYDPWLHTS